MFEDSLMESARANRRANKYWPFISLFVNAGAMIALVIWPLFQPQALPTQMIATLMVAPSPPPLPPRSAPVPKVQLKSEMLSNQLQAPSKIPKAIAQINESAIPPSMEGVSGMEDQGGKPGSMSSIIGSEGTGTHTVVIQAASRRLTISSGLMAGYLLDKTVPQYPAIAKVTHTQGTVILQATIAKTGVIENFRVISGPPMLQQAAIDAIRSWRYKPYLLNGDPVEVETTINVVFRLGE